MGRVGQPPAGAHHQAQGPAGRGRSGQRARSQRASGRLDLGDRRVPVREPLRLPVLAAVGTLGGREVRADVEQGREKVLGGPRHGPPRPAARTLPARRRSSPVDQKARHRQVRRRLVELRPPGQLSGWPPLGRRPPPRRCHAADTTRAHVRATTHGRGPLARPIHEASPRSPHLLASSRLRSLAPGAPTRRGPRGVRRRARRRPARRRARPGRARRAPRSERAAARAGSRRSRTGARACSSHRASPASAPSGRETTRIACGRPSSAPQARSSRPASRSRASVGAPWDTKATGCRAVVDGSSINRGRSARRRCDRRARPRARPALRGRPGRRS